MHTKTLETKFCLFVCFKLRRSLACISILSFGIVSTDFAWLCRRSGVQNVGCQGLPCPCWHLASLKFWPKKVFVHIKCLGWCERVIDIWIAYGINKSFSNKILNLGGGGGIIILIENIRNVEVESQNNPLKSKNKRRKIKRTKMIADNTLSHATLPARDFFLAYCFPSGPFTSIFPKPLPISSPVLAVATTWFLCRPAE